MDNSDKVKLSFSGHDTFPFRYTWLKKGVDAVKNDSAIFKKEDALALLGVGKNMVNAIKHWCLLLGVIEETSAHEYSPTTFGANLLIDSGWDPYLEDQATLWLLQWKIANSLSKATTWFFAFNKITSPEFTKEQLIMQLKDYALVSGVRATQNTLNRDVDCFLRTYVSSRLVKSNLFEDSLDCPLTELNLVQETGQRGLFVFNRGIKTEIPNEIFLYVLLDFWNNKFEKREVLSFDDIAFAEGSPGLVFKLDEDALAYRLEMVEKETKGIMRFDETSSLRQVYRREYIDQNYFLNTYYTRECSIA